MESTTGDPVNLRPNEMFPSLPPTREVVYIFANTIKILEGQNLVLSQLVQNVIHNRYQGLSQTSLPDSLFQAISESIMEQVYLFNLLMNHEAQNQQNQDSNQQFLDSLMPPSQLPMDLREEERRSKSHKRDLPKIDLKDGKLPAPTSPPVRKSQATQLVLWTSPSKPSGSQGPVHPHLVSATIVENFGILSRSARRLSRTSQIGTVKAQEPSREVKANDQYPK
jgi:hypothetical protein